MQELLFNSLPQVKEKSFKENYTTQEVAENYAVLERTIRIHRTTHSDEFIENIHYFYSLEQTAGGMQTIIRWTLEGVYMLGFFIKSPQAKAYRKKVAEFLRLCKERQDAKSEQLRKDYLAIADRNATLEAVAISKQKHFNLQINDYKSQLSQQKAKYENEIKLLENKQNRKRDFVSRDEFNKRILNTCKELESLRAELNAKVDKVKSYAFYGD